MKGRILIVFLSVVALAACRKELVVIPAEEEQVDTATVATLRGFYLLNEGNMGSNAATLDYMDFATGIYTRNLYAERNPNVPKELGDVGNDLQVYGNRLYAVINCSNKMEVMTADSLKRIGQVDVPNCRYVAFDGGYAYLTSYAGPVSLDDRKKQLGYVAKIDTATLEIVATCLVGYQPDGIVARDGKLYVANSGGYSAANYEREVSVIDIATFEETKRIEVGINLQYVVADRHEQLWVSSRGDYYGNPSRLYCIDLRTEQKTDSITLPVANYWLDGDSLYVIGQDFSYMGADNPYSYAIIDVRTHEVLTDNFITDGTDSSIEVPYGVCVHPVTKDIYLTDAINYTSPGDLHCYSKEGKRRWTVTTGDIPAHFAIIRN